LPLGSTLAILCPAAVLGPRPWRPHSGAEAPAVSPAVRMPAPGRKSLKDTPTQPAHHAAGMALNKDEVRWWGTSSTRCCVRRVWRSDEPNREARRPRGSWPLVAYRGHRIRNFPEVPPAGARRSGPRRPFSLVRSRRLAAGVPPAPGGARGCTWAAQARNGCSTAPGRAPRALAFPGNARLPRWRGGRAPDLGGPAADSVRPGPRPPAAQCGHLRLPGSDSPPGWSACV
jgi:hypothetical protein